ncbi:hypothetical protein VaNZ11_000127 [Volvox africanus]|uniref:Myb-like domain-containing protein n=1 Tax=Volvox africanus TaxID=51714 RepID=A0ABQ5RLP9_9CHLO|nr:hypothetical protein VaNZ11_000127 [Volvox africanus]
MLKEQAGYKVKRPNNFWAPFISWWRHHHDATGRRATSAEIREWYKNFAHVCWSEEDMPDISDVLTHSKGMRTTQQIQKFFRKYRLARKCKEMAARNMMSQGDNALDPMDDASLAEDALVGKNGRQWAPPILGTGRVIDSGGNTAPGGSPGQAYPALPVNMANKAISGTSPLQDSLYGQGILNFDVVRSGAAGNGLDATMVPSCHTTNLAAACSQHPGYGLPSAASELHNKVVALLLACGDTVAAASLPVASLHTELRHLATLRRWRQALEAEEAQLQGQASRPPPKQFCTGSGEPQPCAMCVDVSTVEKNAQINAPTETEDLDRTQPQHDSSCRGPATDMAGVACCQSGGGPSCGGTVQLVLGMTEDLQRNGLTDLAGQLFKPLLEHGAYMDDEQLRNLGNIMTQGGMKMDLPSLLKSMAAGVDSSGREAVAVISAIMSGHTGLR